MSGSNRADPGFAPKICAASPTLTHASFVSLGPLVMAPQSGFEHRLAARFASVAITLDLNRSSLGIFQRSQFNKIEVTSIHLGKMAKI
jgi:hypothetical protein